MPVSNRSTTTIDGSQPPVSALNQTFGLVAVILLATFFMRAAEAAGTWTPLANKAPGNVFRVLLQSDGTIFAQNDQSDCFRLTPSASGSYVNGTWTLIAHMIDSRLYYASQVLKDGRIFVAGGEYGSGQNNAEVYNHS